MLPASPPRDREMVLNPGRWPHTVLPLKRSQAYSEMGTMAVFCPPMLPWKLSPEDPITVRLGNMFDGDLFNRPKVTYKNVDALLADGWRVD